MNDYNQWPVTVDQAVGVLLGMLPKVEADKIAAISRDDLIIELSINHDTTRA